MSNLVDLPGVKGGVIRDVKFVRSVSRAMKVLATERAVTGAGDHGAWTVWNDDDGAWRCEYSRFRIAVNNATFATKAAVKAWLTEWLPRADG